ncbi:unnamed protein product [Miscanthus lutarioriparius]|uniref:[RNA-polymerase]-subunit kinase n=1 Tax=Miscanthus lutarioriparius TaxID=422564 RepID=A0A811S0A0_9POAL|nr:unnamed protein product [Miscanthus lutarioriparius]
MAMRMMAAAAAVALVAVMGVLAPRAKWRGGSSTEETSSQNSSSNQTGAHCYTGKTPDADAEADAAAQAASAATAATPPPLPPHPPRRDDELVDGWPTWLLDNVPREVLQGIVPKSVHAYEKIEKVGEGSYSSVYKARERGTGRIVALKKVWFNASDSESVRFMAREIQFLRRLDHPNVMKLEGIATSRRSIYLVFDFMYDDLSRLVFRSGRCLTEPQGAAVPAEGLPALDHSCHSLPKHVQMLIRSALPLISCLFGLRNKAKSSVYNDTRNLTALC